VHICAIAADSSLDRNQNWFRYVELIVSWTNMISILRVKYYYGLSSSFVAFLFDLYLYRYPIKATMHQSDLYEWAMNAYVPVKSNNLILRSNKNIYILIDFDFLALLCKTI
jgi:hypothetical protein